MIIVYNISVDHDLLNYTVYKIIEPKFEYLKSAAHTSLLNNCGYTRLCFQKFAFSVFRHRNATPTFNRVLCKIVLESGVVWTPGIIVTKRIHLK